MCFFHFGIFEVVCGSFLAFVCICIGTAQRKKDDERRKKHFLRSKTLSNGNFALAETMANVCLRNLLIEVVSLSTDFVNHWPEADEWKKSSCQLHSIDCAMEAPKDIDIGASLKSLSL